MEPLWRRVHPDWVVVFRLKGKNVAAEGFHLLENTFSPFTPGQLWQEAAQLTTGQ